MSFQNVVSIRPAPTTSTRDSATCSITSALPRPNLEPSMTPRALAFMADWGLHARASPGGGEAEQQAGEDRDAAVKASTRPSMARSRKTGCREVERKPTSSARSPLREDNAERRAGEREQQAFGEQLADEAGPRPSRAPCGWRFPSAAPRCAPAAGSRRWRRRSAAPRRRSPSESISASWYWRAEVGEAIGGGLRVEGVLPVYRPGSVRLRGSAARWL